VSLRSHLASVAPCRHRVPAAPTVSLNRRSRRRV
jgi:hypothetical protein